LQKILLKKYKKLELKNDLQFRNHLTITKILNKINIRNQIEKLLEAERIVRWSMHVIDYYSRNMYNILTSLKKNRSIFDSYN